ncbi:MAG: hypothetical protein KME46_10560 [Brasilonema angustatum HA4187-MV1]|jgi:hypothetical protein|nr:hypothetical protein [Brasilonema angustatum HA4187-MV1]
MRNEPRRRAAASRRVGRKAHKERRSQENLAHPYKEMVLGAEVMERESAPAMLCHLVDFYFSG